MVRKVIANFHFNITKTAERFLGTISRFCFRLFPFYMLFLRLFWRVNKGRCDEREFPPCENSVLVQSICAGFDKPFSGIIEIFIAAEEDIIGVKIVREKYVHLIGFYENLLLE